MLKKGQIDNNKEFLKLYPERLDLNIKDLDLRAKYQILKKSATYEVLSTDLRMELNKSMAAVKSQKSKIIRNQTSICLYENALARFEKAVIISRKMFKENLNLELNLSNLNSLENKLLKLPSNSLKKLILSVINKSGIFLLEEKKEKEPDMVEMVILHQELEKMYQENKKNYSLKKRRHLANVFCTLRKAKSGPGNQRAIKNYCNRIIRLREILINQ